MAIIYTYPEINEVEGEDLLLISDTSLYKRPTRSVTIDNLATYIGTVVGVVQDLQSVLTVGNTYVSPDGHGTFTLNDIANNNGNIKYVNTDEGWGYFLNAEEGLFFTDGTGNATGSSGVSRETVYIGNGTHQAQINSTNLTANRIFQLPDAAGTIALENLSEWYSVTGSRALGDLVVKIGDYDGSGNGIYFTVNDDEERFFFTKGNTIESSFIFSGTQDRDYTFPNASGTLALTSELANVVYSNQDADITAEWTFYEDLLLDGANLGIGITNPQEKIEVAGNIKVDKGTTNRTAYLSDDGLYISRSTVANSYTSSIIADPGNSNNLDINARSRISLKLNTNTVLIANDSGNVGIGTTSPDYALHVDPTVKIGDRQGTDGSLILQSQQGPNITLTSIGDNLDISGSTGSSNGNTIRLLDEIKVFEFNANIGGTIRINRGNRGLMDTNIGGYVVQQQNTTSSNGKSTFLSTDSSGTILRSTSYGGTGTSGDIKFQFGGGTNTSEPAPATKVIIKNDGKVGIGTTSPGNKLTILGPSSNQFEIINSANNKSWRPNVNGTSFYITESGVSNPFVIQAGGNVGIGTTSPSEKLEVVGNVKLDGDNRHIYFGGNNTFIGERSNSTELELRGGGNSTAQTVYIDNSGKIGVGTNNPTDRLHIVGDNVNLSLDGTGAPGTSITTLSLSRGTVDWGIHSGVGGANTFAIRDNQNSSYRLTINGSGNVGIGTTSPIYKLDVFGDIRTKNEFFWGNNNNSPVGRLYAGGQTAVLLNTSTDGFVQISGGNATSNGGNIGLSGSTNADPNIIRFRIGGAEVMRVAANNNVGIGTTSPSEKLEVAGKAIIRRTGTATAHGDTDFLVTDATAALSTAQMQILGGNAGYSNLYFSDTDSHFQAGIEYLHASDSMNIRVNASTAMTINSSRNIGIGTSSPTVPLHIKNDAPTIRLEDNTSGDNHYLTGNNGEFRVQSTGYITIRPGNTVSTRFDANGNVGIGTTAPTTKLQVNGDVRIFDENELYFGGTGSVPNWEIKASGTDLIINDTGTNVGSVLFNNDEGVVLPRLTTTEINAISLPNTGLTVYNTTLNTLCFYNGSSWQKVSHTNM